MVIIQIIYYDLFNKTLISFNFQAANQSTNQQ